jgi:hypothetical protein
MNMNIELEFTGIEQRGPFLFANAHLRIGHPEDTIGFINISAQLPVANRDQSLHALRESLLDLVRQAVNTDTLAGWMTTQRTLQATQPG